MALTEGLVCSEQFTIAEVRGCGIDMDSLNTAQHTRRPQVEVLIVMTKWETIIIL